MGRFNRNGLGASTRIQVCQNHLFFERDVFSTRKFFAYGAAHFGLQEEVFGKPSSDGSMDSERQTLRRLYAGRGAELAPVQIATEIARRLSAGRGTPKANATIPSSLPRITIRRLRPRLAPDRTGSVKYHAESYRLR
jgi:hypothetical protein